MVQSDSSRTFTPVLFLPPHSPRSYAMASSCASFVLWRLSGLASATPGGHLSTRGFSGATEAVKRIVEGGGSAAGEVFDDMDRSLICAFVFYGH